MSQKYLKISLIGKGIQPSSIRAGEVAVLLESLENLIESIVQDTHPELNKENLGIALIDITPGSLELTFASKIPELVSPAVEQAAQSIQLNRCDLLPSKSIPPLKELINLTKKHKAQLDFIAVNGSSQTLATLTEAFNLPAPFTIQGQTIIYGEIIRVGGADPKIEIKTIFNKILYCPFDKALAGELGARLYQKAGFQGIATWDGRTKDLLEFTVTALTPYQNTPISQAFQELSEIAGKYYADIEDVNQYLAKLRGAD